MRGNRHVHDPPDLPNGSIPACAGEPDVHGPDSGAGEVYPRVCGGTMQNRIRTEYYAGLSPRVRGNHSSITSNSSTFGSIPACAGEPARIILTPHDERVYPRVCGGTSGEALIETTPFGLSPRVRGNRQLLCAAAGRARSIPACAGEPCHAGSSAHPGWVYPRVCGGTHITTSPPNRTGGLSPRVRGNPGWWWSF